MLTSQRAIRSPAAPIACKYSSRMTFMARMGQDQFAPYSVHGRYSNYSCPGTINVAQEEAALEATARSAPIIDRIGLRPADLGSVDLQLPQVPGAIPKPHGPAS